MKNIGNFKTSSEDLQLGYRDGFGIEKCAKKRRMTAGIEQRIQDINRTLIEKETYQYLGILEADTIKQAEVKAKFKRVS